MNNADNIDKKSLKDKIIELKLNTIEKFIVPDYIQNNLNHTLRGYQKEALAIFDYYISDDCPFKNKNQPIELLFNMATGSGKTLVMASLILQLYTKGYRNFIFFVNSTNIITKTLDNFLNTKSTKCLFTNEVFIEGKKVNIKQVNNFNSNDGDDINIIFTTIHSLHNNLKDENENSFGIDEISRYKVVLLADEAHHFSSSTKNKDSLIEDESWEGSINKIMSNTIHTNILLEFSATIDFDDPEIVKKYQNRTIYEYGLKTFYENGYSKDINLLQIGLEEELNIEDSKLVNTNSNLMLVAILVNLYREQIAIEHNIRPFKPVILFKAQQTIEQSHQNYKNFNNLIATLNQEHLTEVLNIMQSSSTLSKNSVENHILPKVVHYFKKEFSTNELVEIIKDRFKIDNIIDINYEPKKNQANKKLDKTESKILEKNNKLINTLELPQNNIRAIFAVNKLNEGWDVLNLYDIVRLYNTRDNNYKTSKIGSTTMQEAQLIGRGARYYPFTNNTQNINEENIENNNDDDTDNKYKRKFDYDLNNPLRILETMYYFSCRNVRYISELKDALLKMGAQVDQEDTTIKTIKIKEDIVNNLAFSNATIYLNHKEKKNKQETFFDILNDTEHQAILEFNWKDDFEYTIGNELSSEHNIIKDNQANYVIDDNKMKVKSLSLKDFDDTILKSVLLYFDAQFNSKSFLVDLKNQNIKIKFKGDFTNISSSHKFKAFFKYFSEISKNTKFKDEIGSTTFKEYKLSKLLKPTRVVKILHKKEKDFDDLSENIKNDNFFIYDKLYTDSSTEIDLYEAFKDFYNEELKGCYKSVFFIRNHLELALYTFAEGAKFYPDFIFVLESLQGDIQTFQVILEAKGEHLADNENNTQKQKFLEAINNKTKIKYLYKYSGDKQIKIIANKFFTKKDNNYFDDVIKEINKHNKKM